MQSLINQIRIHKNRILTVTLGQAFAAVGTFLGVRLMTEYLPPSLFGEYKLVLAAVSFVSGICIRPVIQFLMREYHEEKTAEGALRFMLEVRRLFGKYTAFLALISVLIFYVAVSMYEDAALVIGILASVTLFLIANVEFERAMLVTRNKQSGAVVITVARNFLVPLAVVGATALWAKTLPFAFTAMCTILLSILVVVRHVDGIESRTNFANSISLEWRSLLRSALRYGAPLAAVGVLSWLVNESDRFFLLYYRSEEVVGIYSAAYGIVSAPFTLVVGSMSQFLYPHVFKTASNGDKLRSEKALRTMLVLSTVICIFGVVIVALFDDQIVWLALGDEYRDGARPLLIWVASGYAFLAISTSFDLFAFGNKRTINILTAYGLAAAVNVTLNLMLIPPYGALGAVWATSVSLFIYLLTIASLHMYQADAMRPDASA